MKTATLQSYLFSFLLVSLLCGLAACVERGEERLGDLGESCFVDTDCRGEALCVTGVCTGFLRPNQGNNSSTSSTSGSEEPGRTGSGSVTGGNATSGSVTGGSGSSGTSTGFYSCQDVCTFAEACGLANEEECTFGCEEDVQSWSEGEFDEFAECLFSFDCGSLDRAVEICYP